MGIHGKLHGNYMFLSKRITMKAPRISMNIFSWKLAIICLLLCYIFSCLEVGLFQFRISPSVF